MGCWCLASGQASRVSIRHLVGPERRLWSALRGTRCLRAKSRLREYLVLRFCSIVHTLPLELWTHTPAKEFFKFMDRE